MKKLTECYVCNPIALELYCPVDPEHKITWSEYEEHIWCYDCVKDIKYEHKYKPSDKFLNWVEDLFGSDGYSIFPNRV
jgi:hypothetical protein